ncbi:class I adenylate-forming enzyme family protein [Agaricicola taiwanensis]|nr:AMP-binding protein [Agaricicola taiwanensis]
MRVERFLEDSAARHPAKTALVAGGRRISFAELDRETGRFAAGLIALGFQRGDRAVIFMDNAWEAVVAIFGVLKAGGVFSPVNASTKADKLGYILGNCRASTLITQHRLAPVAQEAASATPSVTITVVANAPEGTCPAGAERFEAMTSGEYGDRPKRFAGIEIDLAMLVYTSGSTGFPKGVMMTHQNVVAAASSITTYLENTADDIILNALPISFDYGLYQVLMAMKLGATLVLEKSFTFPAAIFKRVAEEKVTGLPLVPTMAAIVLQMRDLKPGDYPTLRYITNTAAALPPAHIDRLRQLFPSATVYSMYGLTECKRCTYLPPAELDRRAGSVGIAIPGTEAYVVDETGRRVGPNVVGELVIRGPHVMKGYWENEEATAKALRSGPFPWEKVLHTGDLFRTDADGFLYFVGRKDDIIKTKGEKVSPKEVENVLYALAGVREAAVIGVPDPILGEALRAVIALEPGAGLTEADIARHCVRNLEDFMVPRQFDFHDELPKTDTGKISRRLVAELSLCGMTEAAE